jgi:hypothetical protein
VDRASAEGARRGDVPKPPGAAAGGGHRRWLGVAGLGAGALLMIALIMGAVAVLMSNLNASRNLAATQAALISGFATPSAPAVTDVAPTLTALTAAPTIAVPSITPTALPPTPTAVLPTSSIALYRDNFSNASSGWCVASTKSSSLAYTGGEYVVNVITSNWFVWCNPGQNFNSIHVEATAKNVGNTPDTIFGVICNDQKASQQHNEDLYYLGFSSSGHYTITLTKGGVDQVFSQGTSPDIATNAINYTVGADCSGGQYVLYANGKKIASASDSTYTSGDVGLFAWTGDKVPAEIHYDDIVVTKLGSVTPTALPPTP